MKNGRMVILILVALLSIAILMGPVVSALAKTGILPCNHRHGFDKNGIEK